jgi:ATP-dependent Lhr-like helicase
MSLFALMRRAYPYRNLPRADFDAVRAHAGRGLQHAPRPPRGAAASRCGQQDAARPRKGARLTAITSGGAIPDNADYR